MGNDLSRPGRSVEEHDGGGVEAKIAEHAAKTKEKMLPIYRERREAKQRRLAQEQSATEEDLEPGEVPVEAPGEAEPVERTPSRSQQSTSNASDLLAAFKPRKERDTSKHTAPTKQQQSNDEEFVGFGHVLSESQDAHDKPIQQLPKLKTKSIGDTSTSASGTPSSAKASSATPAALSAKRPAPDTASAHEKKPSLSSLPKIQKRTSVASPQSPERSEGHGQELAAVGDERPPRWYKDLPGPKSRAKNESNVDTLLASLRTQIRKCKTPGFGQDKVIQSKAFTEIRNKLHTIIFCEVTGPLLKLHRMLHNEDGLPQMFDPQYNGGVVWPFDIRADAKELYNKWCRHIFETDILRGIRFQVATSASKKEGGPRNADSIDPKYKGAVSAKYHGNGDLLNGQWWPLQLCALRDGAHGVSQGGISGRPGEGAFSCILSGGHDYPDIDNGAEVYYCGTDSTDGSATGYTQLMLESADNGNPVRLIRSHNLKSQYAPVIGFRYDGLYKAVETQRMDSATSLRQRHRFHLVRLPGQDPIRGGDGPERRPTAQEVEEYKKHQRLSGKLKGTGN